MEIEHHFFHSSFFSLISIFIFYSKLMYSYVLWQMMENKDTHFNYFIFFFGFSNEFFLWFKISEKNIFKWRERNVQWRYLHWSKFSNDPKMLNTLFHQWSWFIWSFFHKNCIFCWLISGFRKLHLYCLLRKIAVIFIRWPFNQNMNQIFWFKIPQLLINNMHKC